MMRWYFFGVMMLAIAIYLISTVVPADQHAVVGRCCDRVRDCLHALDPLPAHATGWSRLWKGLGVVLLIGGLAILLGMLAGSRNLLQPLDVFKGAPAAMAMAAEQKAWRSRRSG
jgi:thiol:disulfide interchange protein DsbD